MGIQEVILFVEKHLLLILLWLISLLLVLFFFIYNWIFSPYKISVYKAVQLINKQNAIVVDVRSYGDFCNGHIISSINLALSDINKNVLCKLYKDKEKPIIFIYNKNIIPCALLRIFYSKKDFKSVYILNNGIVDWVNSGLPLKKIKVNTNHN